MQNNHSAPWMINRVSMENCVCTENCVFLCDSRISLLIVFVGRIREDGHLSVVKALNFLPLNLIGNLPDSKFLTGRECNRVLALRYGND